MLPWWTFAIGSAIFTAVKEILEKKVLFKEYPVQYEAVHKFFLFFLIMLFIPYVDFQFPTSILWLIILMAIGGSIAGIFIAKAYRKMEISEAVPLKNLNPILLLVLAYFLLGERVSLVDFGGIILLLVGAYVLEANHHLGDFTRPFRRIWKSKHIHYILIALTIWAFTSIGNKYVIGFVTPVTQMFFLLFFISITTITISNLLYDGLVDIKKGIKIYGGIIFLAAVLEIFSLLAFFKAISLAYISLVIPVKRLSTFFATVVGGEIFHEKYIMMKAVACLIMIAGATLVIL